METDSVAHGAASPLNSRLCLRAMTSAVKWRWRAWQKKRNNKAAFLFLSTLWACHIFLSMKRDHCCLCRSPLRCFIDAFKRKDLDWVDGKSSNHIFTFITITMGNAQPVGSHNSETVHRAVLPNHSFTLVPRIAPAVTFSFCSWLSI